MKVRVEVKLKGGVLDPQGEAIRHALNGMGFDSVQGVRQSKLIDLELTAGTEETEIRDMCDKLLANPVIESYQITVL